MKLQIGDGTTWTDLTPDSGTIRLIDIERVAARREEDVTEKATFSATTAGGAAEAALLAVQQWFDKARLRQTNIAIPRVMLRLRHANDTDWWRAEIRDGSAASETTTRQAQGGISRFGVTWVREAQPYAETETTAVVGATVYNTSADGNLNYYSLGNVSSAALSPLRLAITNNNTSALAKIFAGLYLTPTVSISPLTAATTQEAEAGTVLAGTGTITASGSASGGSYRAFSWSSGVETALLKWALSATSLSYLGARAWRAFARVTAAPSNVSRMRVSLRYGSLTVAQTELAPVAGSALIELPALPVPPYEASGSTYSGLDLVVSAVGSSGLTSTLNLDALHLLPTDGYRVYTAPTGGTLAQNEVLHDRPNSEVVHQAASGAVRSTFAALGQPLRAGLGWQAVLMMLLQDASGGAGIGLNVGVSAYYQARRRTAI